MPVAPVISFVYRPFDAGGNQDNIYESWVDLMTALATVDGRKILEFDDSLTQGAGCRIPQGTYNMHDVVWAGYAPRPGIPRSKVIIEDGVVFQGLRMIAGQITIEKIASASPVPNVRSPISDFLESPDPTDPVANHVHIGMRDDCGNPELKNLGGEPLFAVGPNCQVLVFAQNCLLGIDIDERPLEPLFFVARGAKLTINLMGQNQTGSNLARSESGSTVRFAPIGSSAQIAVDQSATAGTLDIAPVARVQRKVRPRPPSPPSTVNQLNRGQDFKPNELLRCDGNGPDGSGFTQVLPAIKGGFFVRDGVPLYTGGQEIVVAEVAGGHKLAVVASPGDTIDGSTGTLAFGPREARIFASDGESNWITIAGASSRLSEDVRPDWRPWYGVSEGRTTPGGVVTAGLWTSTDRIGLFHVTPEIVGAKPRGLVLTTGGWAQTEWGPWAVVPSSSAEPLWSPGGAVSIVHTWFTVPEGEVDSNEINRFDLFAVADRPEDPENGGVFTISGDPQSGFGPDWRRIGDFQTTPGSDVRVTSLSWLWFDLALFAANTLGEVQCALSSGGEWPASWTSVSQGSTTPGGPITAIQLGQELALLLADPNGELFCVLGTPPDNWTGWTSIASGRTASGGRVNALRWGSTDRIAIFVADINGDVFMTTAWPLSGGQPIAWAPWTAIPAARTSPGAPITAMNWADGRIALFMVDTSNQIVTTRGDPQVGFGPWRTIAHGCFPCGSEVSVVGIGEDVALFAADCQGRILTTIGEMR